MCDHIWLETDYGTTVCVECGLEEIGPIRPRYHDVGDKAPLYISAYSRHKRFNNFLLCVVDPVFATHPPQKTIALLMVDQPFADLDCLLTELKRKKNSSKILYTPSLLCSQICYWVHGPNKVVQSRDQQCYEFFCAGRTMFRMCKIELLVF